MTADAIARDRAAAAAGGTTFAILLAISFAHLLNDMLQALLPSIYPILKSSYQLDFGQVGLITLTFQITASMLQPLVGMYTDRRPMPYSLAVGMGSTLVGLIVLGYANSFWSLLVAAALVGLGSSVFHPESARVARMASGGRHGLAQSVFQVGGNAGQALGPLLAAFIVLPHGQHAVAWFSLLALLGMAVLWNVGGWYGRQVRSRGMKGRAGWETGPDLSRGRIAASVAILVALLFSKYFYLAGLNTYYTFYLMEKFHVSVQTAQLYLFLFMGCVAIGVVAGGPIGDRIGRKFVIWFSILGVVPFTLALPYVNLFWTGVLSVPIGLILASASSAILVYATELMPGKVGTIAGLFFGLSFGMGGLGAAALGELADWTSIGFVYRVIAWLPLLGLLAAFLPNTRPRGPGARRAVPEIATPPAATQGAA